MASFTRGRSGSYIDVVPSESAVEILDVYDGGDVSLANGFPLGSGTGGTEGSDRRGGSASLGSATTGTAGSDSWGDYGRPPKSRDNSALNNPFLNNPAASSANISPGATTANSRRRLSGSFDGIMPSVAERSSAAETGSRKDRANSTPISRRRSIGDGLEEGRTSRANSAPNELSEELAQLASLSAPTSRPGSRPGSPFSAARPARPKRGPNRGMAAVWPIPDPIRDLSADQEEYVADLMADIAEAKRLTLQQVSLARLVSAGSATST